MSFISFLGFIHAKIRIILYKKELLNRKVEFSDFLMKVFPLENNHSKWSYYRYGNCYLFGKIKQLMFFLNIFAIFAMKCIDSIFGLICKEREAVKMMEKVIG